jgi:hypothetical protein
MKNILQLTVLSFLLGLSSCKKNQLGGNSTVQGKVAHHEEAIPNATVYIKFNAKEFPGKDITVYDATVFADAEGKYSFKCYRGNYFLYGVGIDLQATPLDVSGGVPVRVRNNEIMEADIAVTE